jgi:hypothetical protein
MGARMWGALASLRDAGCDYNVDRWCRRVAPQPPANVWEPSGFGEGGMAVSWSMCLPDHRVQVFEPPGSGRGVPGTPDGVQDISRATLPDRRNGTGPIPEGSQASKLDVWGMRFSAETDPPERGGAGGSSVR